MQPHDRLWSQLIFPHCELSDLLALRAVCHAFLAQVSALPLWLPLFHDNRRMRYAERLLGWRGVERAMARELSTLANCDADGVVCTTQRLQAGVRTVAVAGGRVAAFVDDRVQLCDIDTGAIVATLIIGSATSLAYSGAVCDRWVPFITALDRVMLLDCVAARLVDIGERRPMSAWSGHVFCGAGACLSRRELSSDVVSVVRVSAGDAGETRVDPVATVTLAKRYGMFALAQRGRSYLIDRNDEENSGASVLMLIDMATHAPLRTFTLRMHGDCLCTMTRAFDPPHDAAGGLCGESYRVFASCGFVLASMRDPSNDDGEDDCNEHFAWLRISGEGRTHAPCRVSFKMPYQMATARRFSATAGKASSYARPAARWSARARGRPFSWTP